MTWKNRIVGTGESAPDQLLAHPRNWRIHPAFQQEALLGALKEIGWLAEVIVNRRTSEEWPPGERGVETVLDGHLRVRLAMRQEQEKIPVKYVDLTPAEENLALATFDPLSALAVPDAELLGDLLMETETENEALMQLLSGLSDLALAGGGAAKDLPDGEASQEETVTFRVTVPDSLAAETMAVLDTLTRRGLKWARVSEN